MEKQDLASKIKLSSFNDLFGLNDSIREVSDVKEVMIDELHEFKDHPFKLRSRDKFEELVQSIEEHGVLVPGIARIRPQGGYEIIAGHNRVRACRVLGIVTIPMFIRNISDEDAVIAMVDSNIQREGILPSERAKAYRMKYEAIKHQGKRGNSLDEMSANTGDSAKKIQRYIWLSRLIDELLYMIDRKKLGFVPGTHISFLKEKEQRWVLEVINETGIKPSTQQTAKLKELSARNELTMESVRDILKCNDKKRTISIDFERLKFFFSEDITDREIEDEIISLLQIIDRSQWGNTEVKYE